MVSVEKVLFGFALAIILTAIVLSIIFDGLISEERNGNLENYGLEASDEEISCWKSCDKQDYDFYDSETDQAPRCYCIND